MSSQFAVLKKGFGLGFSIAYMLILLGGVLFAFSPGENQAGVLITGALISLIPIAYIAYGSGFVPDDPTPLDPDAPTKRQNQARIMVGHSLVWAVLIMFPLRQAPVLSGFLILLIITLVFVGLAYKTPKVNESDTKDSLKTLEGWVKPAIVIVIALIFIFGAAYHMHLGAHADKAIQISGNAEMAKAVRNGDILEMIALKYREVTSKRSSGNWEAEERRIRGASFDLIPRGDQSGQCDPLAGEQRVTLHQGPPPAAAQSAATLPGFIASVNNWSRPVVLSPGFTDGIPLTPDSYINISTPADAVFITFMTEATGAGTNIILENGVCQQNGNQYVCTGAWRQGGARGTYSMSVQQTGATVRLYANVDGDNIQVCQITILIR
ncbi:MAG TPA: hypothetical protein VJ579_00940 [Candidatus Paceibacterota bacterium]|nr:hypothetical protein [Candidatus Paceibacterota bacterium]